MNTFTLFLTLILFVSSMVLSFAQLDSPDDRIFKEVLVLENTAILSYDKDLLLKAKNEFQTLYNTNNSNSIALYHLTYCEYKLLEMSLRKGNENLFDEYYDSAVEHAELISRDEGFNAEGKILNAAIYMMKIANNSMSAVTLSPKIHALLDESQTIDKNIPRSYLIRGIMKYQTPAIYGGSDEDAVKNFNKAISLFEKQENVSPIMPSWGYLEALAWLGKTQEKLENYDAAMYAYKKALTVQPDFAWVKYSLLPALEEKLKTND